MSQWLNKLLCVLIHLVNWLLINALCKYYSFQVSFSFYQHLFVLFSWKIGIKTIKLLCVQVELHGNKYSNNETKLNGKNRIGHRSMDLSFVIHNSVCSIDNLLFLHTKIKSIDWFLNKFRLLSTETERANEKKNVWIEP